MIATCKNEVRDVIVVGVGGQGILLATDVIASAFLASDYDVKKSEVHGMAQRGGSVQSHVRADPEKVHSPLIPEGGADVLLAFEKMEALRYVSAVNPEGYILYNTQQIPTVPMSTGEAKYPDGINDELAEHCENILPLNALEEARKLNNVKVINTILLGALSTITKISEDTWLQAVLDRVPQRAREVNERAMIRGRKLSHELF